LIGSSRVVATASITPQVSLVERTNSNHLSRPARTDIENTTAHRIVFIVAQLFVLGRMAVFELSRKRERARLFMGEET
jgi:hypothetical protein